jgi:carbon-monoxide dehydrogenase large subunit
MPISAPAIATGRDSPGSGPWTGRRLARVEDERLVTGHGRFVADFVETGQLHAVVLRSQVARGRLLSVDVSAACEVPGVVAVLTGMDAAEAGLGGIPWEVCPPGFESRAAYPGDPAVAEPQPILARDEIRYVGEPIAFVIAETLAAAQDGAEQIAVEIEDLPATASITEGPGPAPLFSYEAGDPAAVDAAMRTAAIVVNLETHVPRLVAAPIETRGYSASYDIAAGTWTAIASAGKPHPVRDTIAQHVLKVDPSRIRLIAPDIGGGFGAKNVAHAELALVLWAAQRLGRPVRWISSRNEAFLSDMQGRDHAIAARLAVDAEGRMLAIDYRSVVNLGAYLAPRAVVPCISGVKVLTGPYRIAAAAAHVDAVHTNTVPTCPYRGAGVPETAFAVERLVDMAAQKLGLDPAEMRRRNLVAASDLPWPTPTGPTLHSVDFPAVLEAALERFRQVDRRAEGPDSGDGTLRRGVGLAFTIEAYGTAYEEAAELIVDGAGTVELRIGTKSGGQSHETSYAQIAADALGLSPGAIRVLQGDTWLIERGHGTGASRSITTGGSAIKRAAENLIAEAQALAATLLQCRPDDLRYHAGRFVLASRSGVEIDLGAIARQQPDGQLHIRGVFQPDRATFPGGCHVASVEVDIETGAVALLDYVAIHDAGTAINPMVVEGQLKGGIAQGIGAALMEVARYDDDSGQAITATFLDYAIPRAADLSALTVGLQGTACASNPLGAKAVGEAGTVAAPAAIANAIVAALADLGVEHIDLPATPAAIWHALSRAAASANALSETNSDE